MATVALVGNAPSSGSTFLSDLLDCTGVSASGPELNLFSNSRLYDFSTYQLGPWRCGPSASAHTTRNCIFRNELPAYGLDAAGYERLVQESPDFVTFTQAFAGRFMALRGKSEAGVLFEKTPQNINAIGRYLSASPDGWFIHIVRNPVHVYASLLKRGFPPWIALVTWLVDVAQFLPFSRHPRVLLVRYEDLVREPFRVIRDVLGTTCAMTGLTEEGFMTSYRDNAYTRLYSGRVDSWSVQQTGVVRDANRKAVDPVVLARFAAGLDLAVNPAYARAYGFPAIEFREALVELGYAETVDGMLKGVLPDRSALHPDAASQRMLGKKALYALATGLPSRAAIPSLLRPVSPAA